MPGGAIDAPGFRVQPQRDRITGSQDHIAGLPQSAGPGRSPGFRILGPHDRPVVRDPATWIRSADPTYK
jgi:hypothetical protein